MAGDSTGWRGVTLRPNACTFGAFPAGAPNGEAWAAGAPNGDACADDEVRKWRRIVSVGNIREALFVRLENKSHVD